MTDDEMQEMATAVHQAMDPYRIAGKIAGYRMVVAVVITIGDDDNSTVRPLVTGVSATPEVGQLLQDPEFAKSAVTALVPDQRH